MDRSAFEEVFQRSRDIAVQTSGLRRRGEHRREADLFREAALVQSAAAWRFHNNARNDEDWTPGRDRCLHWVTYCVILLGRYFVPSSDDKEHLERVMRSEEEPRAFRMISADTLAMLAWDQNEREEAAAYLREGIFICNSSTSVEDLADADLFVVQTPKTPEGQFGKMTHSQFLSSNSLALDMKLAMLEGRAPDHELASQVENTIWGVRGDGTPVPRRKQFTPLCKSVPPHLRSRTFVGGSACDACGAPPRGAPRLPRCCPGCRRAYYCSDDCMRSQQPQHAPHCRGEGDFRPGDVLKLDYLRAKPEYNGELVRAVELVQDRWSVEMLSPRNKKLAIKPENLEHIRPPA